MTETAGAPRVIALISSSLQRAVIDRAAVLGDSSIIVGHRGSDGDITFERSVLNDAILFPELERLLGEGPAEVFLPNSLSAAYYFCAAHPQVERISYVDEGRLTKKFIAQGRSKPPHFLSGMLRTSFRAASLLPKSFRRLAHRALTRKVYQAIVKSYVKDVEGFPYLTIDRRWKPGILLTHIPADNSLDWVRYVDISSGLDVDEDLTGAACLFLHPKNAATNEQITAIADLIEQHGGQFDNGLLRPHPLFTLHPDRLRRLKESLARTGHDWREVEVSGRNEVSVELYSRGVRTFFVNRSTIEDTIEAYPDFFSKLSVIEVGR